MHRVPAQESTDRPACYGKHPSIIFEGCFSCAARDDCFRDFSSAGVTLLPFASTRAAVHKAGDRRATDILLHGLDASLYAMLKTVTAKYGLRLKTTRRKSYRVRVLGRDRGAVGMVMRLDSRRIVIDWRKVDAVAAEQAECFPVQASPWQSNRRPTFRLDIRDRVNAGRDMTERLDKMLAMSYLAGAFVPGRSRRTEP